MDVPKDLTTNMFMAVLFLIEKNGEKLNVYLIYSFKNT